MLGLVRVLTGSVEFLCYHVARNQQYAMFFGVEERMCRDTAGSSMWVIVCISINSHEPANRLAYTFNEYLFLTRFFEKMLI